MFRYVALLKRTICVEICWVSAENKKCPPVFTFWPAVCACASAGFSGSRPVFTFLQSTRAFAVHSGAALPPECEANWPTRSGTNINKMIPVIKSYLHRLQRLQQLNTSTEEMAARDGKRKVLSLEQRVAVVKSLDSGKSVRLVAKDFGCGKTNNLINKK